MRLTLVMMLWLLPVTAFATTTPFINELHYDNGGVDTGEGVEIAGLAGTVLDGWSLLLYNGSNGGVYRTVDLSGTITDQANGYGAIFFDTGALQNGDPDGIALIDDMGLLQQFLSYEGVFVATEGAAAGQTSTEIPLAESSDTPAGFSLALVGTGLSYNDFAWAAGENSYGAINSGQSFSVVPLPASLPLLVCALAGLLGAKRKHINDS